MRRVFLSQNYCEQNKKRKIMNLDQSAENLTSNKKLDYLAMVIKNNNAPEMKYLKCLFADVRIKCE